MSEISQSAHCQSPQKLCHLIHLHDGLWRLTGFLPACKSLPVASDLTIDLLKAEADRVSITQDSDGLQVGNGSDLGGEERNERAKKIRKDRRIRGEEGEQTQSLVRSTLPCLCAARFVKFGPHRDRFVHVTVSCSTRKL
ncbi:hypothetical protein NQZ68_000324 [Dissostichus eleginoides]|nr:hypothetical protein NQZ68_000324 [Dissostichus eleginoides]